MDEASARQVVLVQAFDAAETPQWTAEDGLWASRLATQDLPGASPERWLGERARHALQRLAPRDRQVHQWITRTPWRWSWLLIAAGLGALAGLMADLLGRQPLVNLLAPPVWAVIVWNLAVYAVLLLGVFRRSGATPGRIRRPLLAWWQRAAGRGPLRDASARWATLTAALTGLRVAALLHLAAAALAGGLIAGLYLRGLVFDYRVGWQSTFLDASTVRQWLAIVFAPASTVTGIGVPDAAAVEAMRVTPTAAQSPVSAAPWLHLFAATLALAVVGPRLLLCGVSLARAGLRARRVALPLDDPSLQALLRRHRGGAARVQVLPYATAIGAPAALGLRALLAREYGEALQLQLGEVTPVGDEDGAARRVDAGAATLLVAAVDLGATPEAEHHGRFLRALRSAAATAPLLLLADEAAFRRRFGNLPGRMDERRAAWRELADAHDVRWLCVDLESPDLALADAALKQALGP